MNQTLRLFVGALVAICCLMIMGPIEAQSTKVLWMDVPQPTSGEGPDRCRVEVWHSLLRHADLVVDVGQPAYVKTVPVVIDSVRGKPEYGHRGCLDNAVPSWPAAREDVTYVRARAEHSGDGRVSPMVIASFAGPTYLSSPTNLR